MTWRLDEGVVAPLSELTCVGRDGVCRIFWYSIERDEAWRDEIRIRVVAEPNETQHRWFELILVPLNETGLRIREIDHNYPEFSAKGIPDALLPELVRRLSADIWSSVKWNDDDPSERRTAKATQMWERLVAKGLATSEGDRFVCRRPS